MNRDDVRNDYFEWMINKITTDCCDSVSYRNLLSTLHHRNFVYHLLSDENRAEDGKKLRWRYAHNVGENKDRDNIHECLAGPCSILEMMVALAIRIEETIMDDPRYGNRTGQWFWTMIANMGLGGMYNEVYDHRYVNKIITDFLNREYDADGTGGLFRIGFGYGDARKKDIWNQMCIYLDKM